MHTLGSVPILEIEKGWHEQGLSALRARTHR
jgi:hypothetical protein